MAAGLFVSGFSNATFPSDLQAFEFNLLFVVFGGSSKRIVFHIHVGMSQ